MGKFAIATGSVKLIKQKTVVITLNVYGICRNKR